MNEQVRSLNDHSVRLKKLSKTYKNLQAVKELELDMKNGDLFCLLGVNGAGKSTTINNNNFYTVTTIQ